MEPGKRLRCDTCGWWGGHSLDCEELSKPDFNDGLRPESERLQWEDPPSTSQGAIPEEPENVVDYERLAKEAALFGNSKPPPSSGKNNLRQQQQHHHQQQQQQQQQQHRGGGVPAVELKVDGYDKANAPDLSTTGQTVIKAAFHKCAKCKIKIPTADADTYRVEKRCPINRDDCDFKLDDNEMPDIEDVATTTTTTTANATTNANTITTTTATAITNTTANANTNANSNTWGHDKKGFVPNNEAPPKETQQSKKHQDESATSVLGRSKSVSEQDEIEKEKQKRKAELVKKKAMSFAMTSSAAAQTPMLINKAEFTDVCGDGSVLKKIVAKGEGVDTPSLGSMVFVHYTGSIPETSKVFDSSLNRGKPFSFELGVGVIQGWSDGVATMRKGERAEYLLQPKKAYGARGSQPNIKPNATLHFEIELLDWVTEEQLYARQEEEDERLAQRRKQKSTNKQTTSPQNRTAATTKRPTTTAVTTTTATTAVAPPPLPRRNLGNLNTSSTDDDVDVDVAPGNSCQVVMGAAIVVGIAMVCAYFLQ